MAELLLLSGLPGVGKTTTAKLLQEWGRGEVARIHFGALLREAVAARLEVELSHEAFREAFAELLCEGDFIAASAAARAAADGAEAKVCVLDSHAVAPVDSGLLATPDGPRRTALLGVTGLVHIAAAGAVERIVENGGREGRRPWSAAEVDAAEGMQVAVMVAYGMAYECPLVVVDSGGRAEDVAARVESAMKSIFGGSP